MLVQFFTKCPLSAVIFFDERYIRRWIIGGLGNDFACHPRPSLDRVRFAPIAQACQDPRLRQQASQMISRMRDRDKLKTIFRQAPQIVVTRHDFVRHDEIRLDKIAYRKIFGNEIVQKVQRFPAQLGFGVSSQSGKSFRIDGNDVQLVQAEPL